jgi:hypothetical protein
MLKAPVLDHGTTALLSTVSTWMGDRYKRVKCEPYKELAGAAVSPVHIVTHREKLIQCLTPREGRVRH